MMDFHVEMGYEPEKLVRKDIYGCGVGGGCITSGSVIRVGPKIHKSLQAVVWE